MFSVVFDPFLDGECSLPNNPFGHTVSFDVDAAFGGFDSGSAPAGPWGFDTQAWLDSLLLEMESASSPSHHSSTDTFGQTVGIESITDPLPDLQVTMGPNMQPWSEALLFSMQSGSSLSMDLLPTSIDQAFPNLEPSAGDSDVPAAPTFVGVVGQADHGDHWNYMIPASQLDPPSVDPFPTLSFPFSASEETNSGYYSPSEAAGLDSTNNASQFSVPHSVSFDMLDSSDPSSQTGVLPLHRPIAVRPSATTPLPTFSQAPAISSTQLMAWMGDLAAPRPEKSPLREEVDIKSITGSIESNTGSENQLDELPVVETQSTSSRPRRRRQPSDVFKNTNGLEKRRGGLYPVSRKETCPKVDARPDEAQPHLTKYTALRRKTRETPTSNQSRKRKQNLLAQSSSEEDDQSGEEDERPLKKLKSSRAAPKSDIEDPRRSPLLSEPSWTLQVPEPSLPAIQFSGQN